MNRIRIAALLLPLAALAIPSMAEAQWRPIYPGYPPYRYAMPEANLRFKVVPKEASIYIDGYYAGTVDDFNGAFERLHVPPGQHDIVVYLEGHHSLHQQLYLSVNKTRTIEGRLEPLPAGAENEPLPTPAMDRDDEDRPQYAQPDPRRGRMDPRERPRDPRDREPETRRLPPSAASTSATLAIRVQPGGATVLIDGERWQGPADSDERLIVQVAPGRHRIEVQRDGYDTFTTDVDSTAGQTLPVNVSLRRDR